jgi:ABC-type antimicrobial peptide transport system permease subunit
MLWLIACVNATNLLLARSLARRRELATRGALGAARWQLMQQMIAEGSALSVTAAIFGIGLAFAAVATFHHALQSRLPFDVPLSLNPRVLGALIALTMISAIISSAWPACIAAHSPIEPALRQGSQQSGSGRAHNRLRARW